jgi:hypothetical protein
MALISTFSGTGVQHAISSDLINNSRKAASLLAQSGVKSVVIVAIGGDQSENVLALINGQNQPTAGISLYWVRHAAIRRRASQRLRNQLVLRHSSHSRPLKLSMKAFCTGFQPQRRSGSLAIDPAPGRCHRPHERPADRVERGMPGSYVYIVGSSPITRGAPVAGGVTTSNVQFVCTALLAAGQFTVPATVLESLPPTGDGYLYVASTNVQPFSAPGLSSGLLFFGAGSEMPVSFN